MDFAYKTYFDTAPSTGYETLIYDCMIGDATLFQRADKVEAGWRVGAAGARRLGEPRAPRISRTTPPAATARRRPTSCWRATAAPGARSNDDTNGGPDGRQAKDLPGARRCRRHAGHRRQGADQARAGRRAAPARRRHPLRHHQRPAAARHGHADRAARARRRRSRASTAAFSSSPTSRSSSRRRCRADVAAPGDRAHPRPRPRCLGLSRQRLADPQARCAACRARSLDRQVRCRRS